MISGIAGDVPAWGIQVLQGIQALQQGQLALQQSVDKSTNSSATAGGHEIVALTNGAGQSPAAVGIWFPETRLELMSAVPAQENALLGFYGLVLLPAQAEEPASSRRKRTLLKHLGLRL